jgi:hypothetical protein
MTTHAKLELAEPIGHAPYRLALAGGWIDQPFVSRHNPSPPGSMVVVSVQPEFPLMNRSGMAGSTRKVAGELWPQSLPKENLGAAVRELYAAENEGQADPSGSQDMIGLLYPGVNRLDYDYHHDGGVFPRHIASNNDPVVANWLARVIHVVPVAPRPEGYSPLGEKNLNGAWINRLGQSGKDCFEAIVNMDAAALGASMNECMKCWEAILPQVVRHDSLTVDLPAILGFYQSRYPGAMYSGCGGGYLYVVSEESVPGAFQVKVRLAE